MRALFLALIYISIPIALLGALYLSQVTAGVGGLVIACYMGIMARLVQASLHHRSMEAEEPELMDVRFEQR